MNDLIYQYDGTFDGFLCCVFAVYAEKENPTAFVSGEETELSFFPVRCISTDREKAQRVYRSFFKISPHSGPFLRRVFLTALPEREACMLRFIRKLYRVGAPLMHQLSDEDYHPLLRAVRLMSGELEMLRGVIRFSDFDGVLAAEIEPKNRVLPVLRSTFVERYRQERFMIFDRTHHEALFYLPPKSVIVPLESFQMALPGETEATFRVLWKRFYDTIAIPERYNPKCRMTQMPKRYWGTMTEFQAPSFFTPTRQETSAVSTVPSVPDGIPAPATHEGCALSAPASAT